MSESPDQSLFGQSSSRNEPADEVFSVSALSRELKNTVEGKFGNVRVQGEISGFKRAASGHCYMHLKDENAVLKAVIWKGTAAKLAIQPEEGTEVIAVGRITTYDARSEYQLVIEHLEVAGIGALLKILQERKDKLTAEGFFDVAHKKPLPEYPQVLGIITSPTGAVIEDIKNRLDERLPVHVLLYPVTVQGDKATPEICQAIGDFNSAEARARLAIPKPDVLIVARGGGSLEDLLPFNDEEMVRAVYNSEIPIISAIGHETDNSLIDFAADVRAPTPTAAAELAVKTKARTIEDINAAHLSLGKAMRTKLEFAETRLNGMRRGLIHPARILESRRQRLDDASEHLRKNIAYRQENYRYRLQNASVRLSAPQEILRAIARRYSESLQNNSAALVKSMQYILEKNTTRLQHFAQLLEHGDYHNVLKRGYAIVRVREGDEWVAAPSLAALEGGGGGARRSINILLQDGDIDATVGGGGGGGDGDAKQRKLFN